MVFVGIECQVSVDLVLVLDISGSTRDAHLLSRILATSVIYGVNVDSGLARVGIVFYSSTVIGQTYLNDHVRDREAVVNALRLYSVARGTTNTAAALNAVRTQQLIASRGSRADVHKARQFTDCQRLIDNSRIIANNHEPVLN